MERKWQCGDLAMHINGGERKSKKKEGKGGKEGEGRWEKGFQLISLGRLELLSNSFSY